MPYGSRPPKRLPKQNYETIMLMADRWQRSANAMRKWSERARECVDFVEGRQWTAEQIAALEKEGRPALTFNKIARLVRLVLGYQRNNKTDIKFRPANEGGGSETVAEVLSKIVKQISDTAGLEYVDAEVFLDGIVTGRGYWDSRLNFDNNDFGEVMSKAVDPFTVYLDPDADQYDLKNCNYIQTSKWVSIDEIELTYGKQVADLLGPFTRGESWTGFPSSYEGPNDEITPVRTFAEEDDSESSFFRDYRDTFNNDFIDPYRKNIRLLDSQHYVTMERDVFIDLETGERKTIPSAEEFSRRGIDRQKFIAKALFHGEQMGNPLIVDRRRVPELRWTIQVGDVLVYDEWSVYDTPTIDAYFPYFRRGHTQGMVDDAIDPQKEINKRRMAHLESVARMGNPMWVYHEDSMDPEQERRLEQQGSRPGFILKWKGSEKPERDYPNARNQGQEKLEELFSKDLPEITGINESALGDVDKVQSGRAIEAKQRQAVISLQMYLDNFSRSKTEQGRKYLELIQGHYKEERIFRILGEDGQLVQLAINQQVIDPVTGKMTRLHDITLGKYMVSIDETPMSATFASAQFDEALDILERLGPVGQALLGLRPDLLIELSSLPRKEEWKEALQQATGQTPPEGQGGPPGGPGAAVPAQPTPGIGAPGQPQIADQRQPASNVVQLPATGGV